LALPAELIERVTTKLAALRRSPFDDARYGLAGSRFAERFVLSGEAPCGRQPRIWWRSRDGAQAGVVGALDAGAGATSYVVLVDAQDVVRGLGEERRAARGAGPGRRWSAMIAGVAAGERYAAWAVLHDGRSVCPLGVVLAPPDAPRAPARAPSP
jgi:hypothetical protein